MISCQTRRFFSPKYSAVISTQTGHPSRVSKFWNRCLGDWRKTLPSSAKTFMNSIWVFSPSTISFSHIGDRWQTRWMALLTLSKSLSGVGKPCEIWTNNLHCVRLSTTLRAVFYDKVSANTACWFPQCYEKSDGSQDAHSWSSDMPN